MLLLVGQGLEVVFEAVQFKRFEAFACEFLGLAV